MIEKEKKQTTLDDFIHLKELSKKDNELLPILSNYISDTILDFHAEQVANETVGEIITYERVDFNNLNPFEEVVAYSYLGEKYPHKCFNPNCFNPIHYYYALVQFQNYDPGIKEMRENHDWVINQFNDVERREYDFKLSALKYEMTKKFNVIWKDNRVKFYCCTCYEKQQKLEKQLKKEQRLLNKAKRLQEKFNINR